MKVQENGAATAEPVAEVAEAAPEQTTAVKKNKVKAKKKVAKPVMDDHEFYAAVLENLYALRGDAKFWVNLRNATKSGENLHKLLLKQPVYRWKVIGVAHYLEARHTGDDKVVAFILPINPKREYEQAMRDYAKALDKVTKRSKPPEKPEKPVNTKPCFQWHIAARKGDDTQGTCLKFDDAMQAVMSRKALFVV